jgi:hypothetical protein
MDNPYKLHVKLGDSEFNGEGSQDIVKADYASFLEAYKLSQGTGSLAKLDPNSSAEQLKRLAEGLLEKAFCRKDDIVSLRHLPPSDGSTRNADAAILLLYGFKKLAAVEDVPVTKLNEGLRASGLSIDRIDRFIGIHSQLFRKGGQRSGGRYSLTNPGEAQAEKWLTDWYS